MSKKILSVIIMVMAFMVSPFATKSVKAEYIPENMYDITVEAWVTSDEGYSEKIDIKEGAYKGISWDEEARTLTLNNVNEGGNIIISRSYNVMPVDINIKLVGENTITSLRSAINTYGVNVNFVGTGSLNIICALEDGRSGYSERSYAVNMYGGKASINGPSIYIKGYSAYIFYNCNASYKQYNEAGEKTDQKYLGGDISVKSGKLILDVYPIISENSENIKIYFYNGMSIFCYGDFSIDNGLVFVNYVSDFDEEMKKEGTSIEYYQISASSECDGSFNPAIIVNSNKTLNINGGTIAYNINPALAEQLKKDEVSVVPFVRAFYSGSTLKDGGSSISPNAKVLVNPGKKIDISKVACKLSQTTFMYDGKAKTPSVDVSGLVAGEDYTVTYSNNINAGTATVKITGKGSFTGSKTLTFVIKATPVAAGQKIKDKKYNYKVLKSASADGKTVGKVAVVGLRKKSLTTLKIATTVTFGGLNYKVTSIGKKAFAKKTKVTKVYIGKNVNTIGANAFAGCKKLKKVVINSKKLKKVGKKAFSKTKKGITFKVPKTKKNTYRKLLKKSGARRMRIK